MTLECLIFFRRRHTYFEEFTKVDEVELVLVSESKVLGRACDVLEQMLDILVVFTGFQARFVVDH